MCPVRIGSNLPSGRLKRSLVAAAASMGHSPQPRGAYAALRVGPVPVAPTAGRPSRTPGKQVTLAARARG